MPPNVIVQSAIIQIFFVYYFLSVCLGTELVNLIKYLSICWSICLSSLFALYYIYTSSIDRSSDPCIHSHDLIVCILANVVGFGIAASMNSNPSPTLLFFLLPAVLQDLRRVLVGEESFFMSLQNIPNDPSSPGRCFGDLSGGHWHEWQRPSDPATWWWIGSEWVEVD